MKVTNKSMKVTNKRWSEDDFLKIRKEVLSGWPTGKEVEDLSEGIAYCKALPWWKRFGDRLRKTRNEGKTLIVAFIGDTTFEQTLDHMKVCEEYAPDAWAFLQDAYSRKNKYDLAQKAIDRSYKEGRPMLNGYPVVNYGVKYIRQLTEATESSFWMCCNDHDPRLAAEIQMAGGWCCCLSQSLHEVLMHGKDYPLDKRIFNDQYINRLAGYYTERGVNIHSINLGNFPGWSTPGVKISVVVLESLIAAEQGVKSLTLSLSTTMNLIQDVAALQVLRELTAEYLARAGYSDVRLYLNSVSCQGAWPRDLDRTASMAAWSIAIAILAGADSFHVRALDEAFNIATKERHVAMFKLAKQIQLVLANQRYSENEDLKLERQMIKAEARATIDKTLELGDGDAVVGQIRAVELGVLDTCFSPYRYLKNDVITVRDNNGALRYFRYGNVPLPKEVAEYNRAKIEEREKAEGVTIDMSFVIKDVTYNVQNLESQRFSC